MNNIDKALLLGEYFGIDTTNFTSSYIRSVIESKSYSTLCENVKWAENFNLRNSSKLISDFKNINYDVNSFEESVIFASRINYLSSVSSEEYYINPLVSYDVPIKTRSIGDLMVTYGGDKHSFNELILDESHPLSYKTNIVVRRVEYYRKEASEKALASFEKTSENKGIRHIIFLRIWKMIFLALVVLLFVSGASYLFFGNEPELQNLLRNFDFNNYIFYGPFIYFLSACVMVFSWFAMFAYFNRGYSPYFYYRKLGRNQASKLYENINKHAQSLAEYIYQAIKEGKPLSNDIQKFALSAKDDELRGYLDMYDLEKKPKYLIILAIFKASIIVCILSAIYIGICLLLARY